MRILVGLSDRTPGTASPVPARATTAPLPARAGTEATAAALPMPGGAAATIAPSTGIWNVDAATGAAALVDSPDAWNVARADGACPVGVSALTGWTACNRFPCGATAAVGGFG